MGSLSSRSSVPRPAAGHRAGPRTREQHDLPFVLSFTVSKAFLWCLLYPTECGDAPSGAAWPLSEAKRLAHGHTFHKRRRSWSLLVPFQGSALHFNLLSRISWTLGLPPVGPPLLSMRNSILLFSSLLHPWKTSHSRKSFDLVVAHTQISEGSLLPASSPTGE